MAQRRPSPTTCKGPVQVVSDSPGTADRDEALAPDNPALPDSNFYSSEPPKPKCTSTRDMQTAPSAGPAVPKLEKLVSSSDSSQPGRSSSSSSSECMDGREGERQAHGDKADMLSVRGTNVSIQESPLEFPNFYFGPLRNLEDFLDKIVSERQDYGIFTATLLSPSSQEGVMSYREGKEFRRIRTVHQKANRHCGVFLCVDMKTKKQFILKTVINRNRTFVGVRFLASNSKAFLPSIYGVYKAQEYIHIFQEFIEGGNLTTCQWNLGQVRRLAVTLLSAFQFLHAHDLVHSDVKLMNLMVRDQTKPDSLVVVDFESAKQPKFYHRGGHTDTYLPPWWDLILNLTAYDPLLKTADLWAIACVLVFFVQGSEPRNGQQRGVGVWSQAVKTIQSTCRECGAAASHNHRACSDCLANVRRHIKAYGDRILEMHIGRLMNSQTDDPDWLALKKLLLYLTDTRNIEEKRIETALGFVRDE